MSTKRERNEDDLQAGTLCRTRNGQVVVIIGRVADESYFSLSIGYPWDVLNGEKVERYYRQGLFRIDDPEQL